MRARGARRRALAVAAALLVVATAADSLAAPAAHADDGAEVAVDPLLEQAVADAARAGDRLPVEIVTSDTTAATREVQTLGGTVTGSVAGEVVQASIAAGRIDEVTAPTAAYLRLPRRVNRPPLVPERHELGPVTGESVAVTNAAAWHGAGLRGAVKVGIIDFFDMGLWNAAEHGIRPDAAHTFCRDTSGEAPSYCPMARDGINDGDGKEHGVAVAEVLKDIAPDAELYIATAATTSDMRAAIDWFAANGVLVVNRSLGAPFDGPGDGTGPLAALVDHAAALGITWFNSAGNDAAGSYGRYTNGVTADGYVDFDNGPGVDTTLTLSGTCIGFDGIRWNDWRKPASAVTDYVVELVEIGRGSVSPRQADQRRGAPPLELVDEYRCNLSDQLALRLRRIATGGDPSPDVVEVALFDGRIEAGRSQAAHSAAKSVVDSSNPSLVAVGAIDPAAGAANGTYSSQGPTNDGRVKPDVAAPSCLESSIYVASIYGPGSCFNGTSASSPVAAGVAALLLGRGLATAGPPLAGLTRHLVVDLGPPGPDNLTGSGMVRLPHPPPTVVDDRPAQFVALAAPRRILDTRPTSATEHARVGPFAPFTVIDVPIPTDPAASGRATAVAVSIASVDSERASYVQALPTLIGQLGGFANLNIARAGQVKPNFAIVPVGVNGSITLLLATGGNVVVDLMGQFVATPAGGAAADGTAGATGVSGGRFVPVDPVRVLDTRPDTPGPVPPGWTPHKPGARSTVPVSGLPTGAAAVVVNVTATQADRAGFVRSQTGGASEVAPLQTANGNYERGVSSGTLSVVPVAPDGSIEIFTSAPTHIVVDLLGWFTGATASPSREGLFVPLTPTRAYDSRFPSSIHGHDTTRTLALSPSSAAIPAGAVSISMNVAADGAEGEGFLTISPAGTPRPLVSNLNYPTAAPISNAALPRLGIGGAVDAYVNRATHVIIDVNGYFTGSG